MRGRSRCVQECSEAHLNTTATARGDAERAAGTCGADVRSRETVAGFKNRGAQRVTVFEDHTPGDTVRCPADGCEFRGTASQVVTHVVGAGDADHAAVERGIDRDRATSAETDRPAVEEFVRLVEAVHGGGANYESAEQGGWLFPFEEE